MPHPDFDECGLSPLPCFRRTLESDHTIEKDETCLAHDMVIADGVELLIKDTGELLVL